MTSRETVRQYVRKQYQDSSNFMARVRLHARFSTNAYGLAHWMFDQFEAPEQAQVLELGAGPAILWVSNAHRIPSTWEIMLSDFSPGMVQEQRQNLQPVKGSFHFSQIDAQAIPFGDETFDLVTANFMLYHVPDIPLAIREIHRVLKPGGRFYATTNGVKHMHELDELADRFSERTKDESHALSFTLENGAGFIEPIFPNVTVRLYQDSLVVTEVEPIVAYVLSGSKFRTEQTDQSPDGFRAFLEQEMNKTGAIHISKSTGTFVASRE